MASFSVSLSIIKGESAKLKTIPVADLYFSN